ncbi:right-handed parallel beta-helix repeat-containing protein [Pseudidiomarina salilacus]|uniref:right-handed parallel beta-helix repeat-containing protein n=1 Tax=Pseudidiomarina salilacus TaxID=3384452 RepID=UPI0039851252
MYARGLKLLIAFLSLVSASVGYAEDLTFTNAAGEKAPGYQFGSDVYVQVVDGWKNLSTVAIETVELTVESDLEPGGEVFILTETGPNTGVFSAKLDLELNGSVSSGDGLLSVTAGSWLHTTYITNPNQPSLEAHAFLAKTLVAGETLSASTTWSKVDSPYLVTGDVVVAESATLTVTDDTELYFAENYDASMSGQDLSRTEIIVAGQLILQGTVDAPIKLTSAKEPNAEGFSDWGGIYAQENAIVSASNSIVRNSNYGIKLNLPNVSSPIVFDGLQFEYSQRAIQSQCNGCPSYSITNNSFDNVDKALTVTGNDGGTIDVSNNTFLNSKIGQLSAADDVIFQNNIVSNSEQLFLSFIDNSLNFSNNTFTEAGDVQLTNSNNIGTVNFVDNSFINSVPKYDGIYLELYSPNAQITFSRNHVEGPFYKVYSSFRGASVAIRTNSQYPVQVIDNQILNNRWATAGLYVNGYFEISGNRIEGNNAGIIVAAVLGESHLYEDSLAVIDNNQIVNNDSENLNGFESFGIQIDQVSVPLQISGNDIYGNGGFQLVNNSTVPVDARNNWWGETLTNELSQGTHPRTVSFISVTNDGFVNYSGWLTSSGGEASSSSRTASVEFLDNINQSASVFDGASNIVLEVTDHDRNQDSSIIETVELMLTSTSINTGTPIYATAPISGSANYGDGQLEVLEVKYGAPSQTWTITGNKWVGLSGDFTVEGSVSGVLSRSLYEGETFTTPDGMVTFRVSRGSREYLEGDSFSFSVVAAQYTGPMVELVETGVDTGVFRLSAVRSSGDLLTVGEQQLSVSYGDAIYAIYDDLQDDWGHPQRLVEDVLQVKTVVPTGDLIGNTIWTSSGGPYYLPGDIVIPAGSSLSVESGAKVFVAANSDSAQTGLDTRSTEIVVYGDIQVWGTSEEPALFTSEKYHTSAESGDWKGIRISSDPSKYPTVISSGYFDNASFGFSETAIDWERHGGVTRYVMNSYFEDVGIAVQSENDWSRDPAIEIAIENSTFVRSSPTFIEDAQSMRFSNNRIIGGDMGRFDGLQNLVYRGNEVTDSGDFSVTSFSGLVLFDTNNIVRSGRINFNSYETQASLQIINNYIDAERIGKAGVGGISVVVPGNGVQPILFSGNTVTNYGDGENLTTAAVDLKTKLFSVVDNTITNNGLRGLNLAGSGEVSGNFIANNTSTGLYTRSYSNVIDSVTVTDNRIVDNSSNGIQAQYLVELTAQYNDIYGNGGFALYNTTNYAADAQFNYWGENAAEELSGLNGSTLPSFISSNNGAGSVNYSNWSTVPYWSLTTYTVTFVDWNGTVLSEQTIESGSAAIEPASPSRSGFTFVGWDKDFSSISSAIVVTAQYEAITPLVSIVASAGGTVPWTSQTVTFGEVLTVSLQPDSGMMISSASGCGGTLTGMFFITEEITSDCTIQVVFDEILLPKSNLKLLLLISQN